MSGYETDAGLFAFGIKLLGMADSEDRRWVVAGANHLPRFLLDFGQLPEHPCMGDPSEQRSQGAGNTEWSIPSPVAFWAESDCAGAERESLREEPR